MAGRVAEQLWQRRMREIQSEIRNLRFPEVRDGELTQDREWCEVSLGSNTRRIRFHDYHEVYRIPGLYERIFYERLRCNSPARVVGLLAEVLRDLAENPADLRVLDVGAGNGMVGDELHELDVAALVGTDIIPEAREATLRDRDGVYHDYIVTDLTDVPENLERRFRAANLNALTIVAALGFDDIPTAAFTKALDLIDTPGWLAFNIKEDFLRQRDNSGFARLIEQLNRDEVIQIQALRRYRHRYAITGEPLHYVAVVAKKLKDVPDQLMNT